MMGRSATPALSTRRTAPPSVRASRCVERLIDCRSRLVFFFGFFAVQSNSKARNLIPCARGAPPALPRPRAESQAGNWFGRGCDTSSSTTSTTTSTTTPEPAVTVTVTVPAEDATSTGTRAAVAMTAFATPRPDAGDSVPCIEAGVDYAGHDLFSGVPATTAGLCQRMCCAYPLCRFFTWSTLQVCDRDRAREVTNRWQFAGHGLMAIVPVVPP